MSHRELLQSFEEVAEGLRMCRLHIVLTKDSSAELPADFAAEVHGLLDRFERALDEVEERFRGCREEFQARTEPELME